MHETLLAWQQPWPMYSNMSHGGPYTRPLRKGLTAVFLISWNVRWTCGVNESLLWINLYHVFMGKQVSSTINSDSRYHTWICRCCVVLWSEYATETWTRGWLYSETLVTNSNSCIQYTQHVIHSYICGMTFMYHGQCINTCRVHAILRLRSTLCTTGNNNSFCDMHISCTSYIRLYLYFSDYFEIIKSYSLVNNPIQSLRGWLNCQWSIVISSATSRMYHVRRHSWDWWQHIALQNQLRDHRIPRYVRSIFS